MRSRSSLGFTVVAVVAVVMVTALTACGSSDSAAVPSAPPARSVTTPVASTAVAPSVTAETAGEVAPGSAEPIPTLETSSVSEADPASAPSEPARADGSPVVGHWQRHASTLDLADVPAMSTLSMGASCCDSENWSVTWTPSSSGVRVVLLARTFYAGNGVDGILYEGKSFSAEPTLGYNGTPVLVTYGLGDDPGISTWCRSGHSVPECGA